MGEKGVIFVLLIPRKIQQEELAIQKALKHNLSGWYSTRITQEYRMIYRILAICWRLFP